MGQAVTPLSMNERAWRIADDAVAASDELRLGVETLPGGARIIDAGIDVPGGRGAGLAVARMCMGGLGHVDLMPLTLAGEAWEGVYVWTDHPLLACMASQYAGWAVNPNGYFAMGSGPLRAKALVEHELFRRLGYAEEASRGVLVLEGRGLPTDSVAAWIAVRAGVPAEKLTIAIAPTATLAGSIQVVARVVETGLHKLDTLGFDLKRVMTASGCAPLPPVAKNDIRAIGRTNDSVLYGGQARYLVDASDEELAALVPRIPSSASGDYGTPFRDVFARYDHDFYRIDPLLFSPAEVWVTSVRSGRTFHAGGVRTDILRQSFFGD